MLRFKRFGQVLRIDVGPILLAIVALLTACKHEPPLPPNTGDDTEHTVGNGQWVPPPDTSFIGVMCDPDTIYFQQSILPIMVSYCASSGCHDAEYHADGVRLFDYDHIRNYVVAGSPVSSTLIEAMNNNMPPSDDPQLTPEQINALIVWINQGARNNSCVPTACDTVNVTFSGTIAPALNTFCTGCHGGASPDGGIDLSTHAGVLPLAIEGSLIGSIQHQVGFHSMPPEGSGLSACRIEQFTNWVDQGAPNN